MVSGKPWVDFVVPKTNPHQPFVESIYHNPKFCQEELLPKLKAFYFHALLPELAVPRDGKSPGIREPGPERVG